MLYSNCERSWTQGCFISSQPEGTLELRDSADGRIAVAINVVFTPDRWGRAMTMYGLVEAPRPKSEVMAISVEAERIKAGQ